MDEIYNWTWEPRGVVDTIAKDGDEEGASGCRRVGAGCLYAGLLRTKFRK